MDSAYLQLSYAQVAAAAALIAVNGLISLVLHLGLERRLLLAAVRSVVQLLLIGLVLDWIFSLRELAAVLLLVAVMTLVAGTTAVHRADRRYPGIYLNSLISVWASAWLIGAVAIFAVLREVEPWYHPQYAIPVVGMILGNTLNGISLGLNRIIEEFAVQRGRIELLLCLGATRWEAALPSVRQALRTGMIPIINVMTVAGLVSLPGMLTGQLLAGVRPIEAVKYQIVILFLIASGTALGTLGVVLLSYRRFFNSRHQFQHWLLTEK